MRFSVTKIFKFFYGTFLSSHCFATTYFWSLKLFFIKKNLNHKIVFYKKKNIVFLSLPLLLLLSMLFHDFQPTLIRCFYQVSLYRQFHAHLRVHICIRLRNSQSELGILYHQLEYYPQSRIFSVSCLMSASISDKVLLTI